MFVTCLPPRYSPHIDTNGKNHVALPLARLDLSVSYQSANNWYKISQHSITRTFLSRPFVLLVLSHNLFFNNVEKKHPTDNKLQNRLIDEVARFH